MRRLLANRDARVYLIGQALSLLGDTSLWLAAGIWVKTLTKSNADAGLVFFFFALGGLSAPASGMLVDRVRRKPLLIVVNLASAAAVLLMLFVHDAGDVWVVYAVMVLYGLSGSLIASGQSAYLRALLPEELLGDANGMLSTVREGLRLVAPLVGAGLFVLVGGGLVAVIDAVSFVCAAFATSLVRAREPVPEPSRHRFLAEASAGFKHVLGIPVLRRMTISLATALLFVGFGETACFAVVASGLHRPPSFLGVILSVQGVGALAGGLSSAPVMRRIGEPMLIGLGLAGAAVGCALFAVPTLWSVAPGAVVFGAALPFIVVGAATLIQRRTPLELQGRAYSAFDLLATVPQTISIGAGALLIGVLGYQPELALMAIAIAGAAVVMLTSPRTSPRPEGLLLDPVQVPGTQIPAVGVPPGALAVDQLSR
jgi:MFS family permease